MTSWIEDRNIVPDSLREVVVLGASTLPMPIAQCLAHFEHGGALSDVFFSVESVLRYLCVAVKSSYLVGTSPPSRRMNELLRRHLLMPSMGDWRAFLVAARKLPGFAQEIWPFVDPEVDLDAVLSASERIVAMRTNLHGHAGATLSDEHQRAAIASLSGPWERVLRGIAALARYELVVFDARVAEWRVCMGTVPRRRSDVPSLADDPSPAAILGLRDGPLRLFPLTVSTFDGYQPSLEGADERAVLVFDGVDVDRERIVYVGSVGRGHGKRWFERYKALVRAKQIPLVPCALDETPIGELWDRVRAALRADIDRLVDEGRWHEEAIRLDAEVAALIDDAIASNAALALVAGDAGAGKSTHVYAAARRADDAGHGVVVVGAQQLLDDAGSTGGQRALDSLLRVAFESKLGVLTRTESLLERFASDEPTRRFVLVIDGLDEIGGARSVQRRLAQIVEWTRVARAHAPVLRVIVTLRGALLGAMMQSGLSLRDLDDLLYRPTRSAPGGGDVVEEAIWIRAAQPDEVETRFELMRRKLPGHRPEARFTDLPVALREACANPRWMVAFLRRYDGAPEVSEQSATESWESALVRHVYARGAGAQGPPLFSDRVKVCEALVRAERANGRPGVSLDELWRTDELQTLVRTERDRDVLVELESNGIVRVEASPHDLFDSPIVRAADEFTAVVMHAHEKSLRSGTPSSWVDLANGLADKPIGEVVARAAVLRLTRVVADAEGWNLLPSLATEMAVDLLLATAGVARATSMAGWVAALPAIDRERLCAALHDALTSCGRFAAFAPFARCAVDWPSGVHGAASIRLVARVLRHAEEIDVAERWLGGLAGTSEDLAAAAQFQLAEVLRDKGIWRRAAAAYDAVTLAPHGDPATRALAFAARGECFVWLREPEQALRCLESALAGMDESAPPWVRCNVYLKQGIAERVRRRPVLAVRALSVALQLALRHQLIVEVAKIELELGMVAALFGGRDEAERLVRSALGRHRAQRFVKGQKKAWYCLGWVLERFKRPEEAIDAYRVSHSMNKDERYYDLFGLVLCDQALGRLLGPIDPEAAESHRAAAQRNLHRLERRELRDELVV